MDFTQKIKSLVYLVCFIACAVFYVATSGDMDHSDEINNSQNQTISLEAEKTNDFSSHSAKL